MLKGLEKAKALKEFKELRLKLGGELPALDKAKTIKRFRELRVLLGGQNQAEPADNPLYQSCLLYTSPSPRDQRGSRMPSSA